MQSTSATDRATLADAQASLRRIATLVAEGATPGELFSAVAREVSVVLDVPVVTVGRYELDGDSPVSVVLASREHASFPVGSRWPLDGAGTREIYENRRPIRIEDFSGLDGTLASAARQQGMSWVVGAPIVVDGAVWGNIYAGTAGDEPILDDAEARLADFTELISTAIANSDAREKVKRLLDEQAALKRVATLVAEGTSPDDLFAAVAREVANLFVVGMVNIDRYENGESVVLASLDDPGSPWPPLIASRRRKWRVGSRHPLDGGLRTMVYATGRPARLDGFANVADLPAAYARWWGNRSGVAVPIIVDGAVWGVLGVQSKEDEPLPPDAEQRLAAFTELVSTAIANSDAREKVGRLLEEQAALRRVATLVAEGTNADDVFAAVAREVAGLFGVGMVNIDRYENGESVVLASFADPGFPVGSRWPLDGAGVRTLVHETGRPARVDDFTGVPGTAAAAARASGIRSAAAVPIVVDGKVWGVLGFGSREDESLPGDIEQRLAAFTELVATAIANAESRGELAASEARARALAEEQAALRRVATLVAEGAPPTEVLDAVAVEVGRLIGGDVAVLSRFEQGGGVTVLSSRPEGTAREPLFAAPAIDPESLTAAVMRTGRPARIDDFGEAPGPWSAKAVELGRRSAVAAPLTVQGSLWGVMAVVSNEAQAFPHDTEDRLAAFTELLATAIANTESREQLAASEARARELAEEQAALRRVATLVAEGAPPHDVLDAVAVEAGRLLGADLTLLERADEGGGATVLAWRPDGIGQDLPISSQTTIDPESLTAAVLRTGLPARIDYAEAPGPWAAQVRKLGFRSAVGAPVTVDGRLWGVLIVTTTDARPWSSDAEDRLAALTELLATAIANTESREQLAASEARARELAEEQAALRRVATLVARELGSDQFFSTVAREVATVMNVRGVLVDRFEADGSIVTVGFAFDAELAGAERIFTIGTHMAADPGSIAAQVFETCRTARVHDFSKLPGTIGDRARAAGLGSGCGGPIVVNGQLWGLMCVFSLAGTVLPLGTESRLQDFIELVATAIANYEGRAHLAASEEHARELANEQTALRRVATLVAQGARPDELFSAVAQEVAGLIGIPVVGVYRYDADMTTFTTVGLAGDRKLAVGTRWPVREDGLAGMILATGRPARKDDYSTMDGPLGAALRDERVAAAAGVPVLVDGKIWGFMAATCGPGESIPAETEQHLERFTELVATGVSNASVRADLIASRARVVSAADETRRRLERDLHDGIQQWLVALALRARKAAAVSAEGESAAEELSDLADDLVAVIDELREISRGIHPAILSDSGLDDALKALARRSAIRVDVNVSFGGRYDPVVEATVYYIAAESLTNAVKHAEASVVTVRGGRQNEEIVLEIHDDGIGGADPQRGTGLIGLKDRVDTLGGTISFASPAGNGTTIRMQLPLCTRSAEGASAPASG